MNNEKIVNLANPTDQQYAVTKKYVGQKTETIDLFSSLPNYAPRSLSIETFIKKKSNVLVSHRPQTVKFFIIVISVSLLSINQD